MHAAIPSSKFGLICAKASKIKGKAATSVDYVLDSARINAGHTLMENGKIKRGDIVPPELYAEYDAIAYGSVGSALCDRHNDNITPHAHAWFERIGYRY